MHNFHAFTVFRARFFFLNSFNKNFKIIILLFEKVIECGTLVIRPFIPLSDFLPDKRMSTSKIYGRASENCQALQTNATTSTSAVTGIKV